MPGTRGSARRSTRPAGPRGSSSPRASTPGLLGPQYETPSEVRMLADARRRRGRDVDRPRVHRRPLGGLEVCGVSLVTNAGAGYSGEPLTHEEVLAAGAEAGPRLARVIRRFVADLGCRSGAAAAPASGARRGPPAGSSSAASRAWRGVGLRPSSVASVSTECAVGPRPRSGSMIRPAAQPLERARRTRSAGAIWSVE